MRLLAWLITLSIALPASAFEGDIKARLTQPGKSSVKWQMQYGKNGAARMDIESKDPKGKPYSTSMILPAKAKHYYLEDHRNKTVMKVAYEPYKATGSTTKTNKKKSNVKVTKLGKEKVAGQSATHVRVEDKDTGEVTDLWISDKYPADFWSKGFVSAESRRSNPNSKAQANMMKKHGIKPGMVLKMVSKDGGETSTFEVTEIRKGKVASARFSPNPKYKAHEMPTAPGNIKMPTTREEAEKLRDEMMKKYGQ